MSFFDSWPAIIGMKINEMWPYLAFGKNFAHFWPFLVNFVAILAKFHFSITHLQKFVAKNKFFQTFSSQKFQIFLIIQKTLLVKVLVTLFKTRPAGNLAEKQVGLPMVGPGRPWAVP